MEDRTERPRLTAYTDYVCPYCYLSESILARLRREDGVEVEYRPLELRPAPAPLLHPADAEYRRAWAETVAPLAARLGVEIHYPPVQPRTRKAHEAAALARAEGRFLSMHEALFRAFFVEGKDIGRIDVLQEVGRAVGLDPTRLKVALDVDEFTDEVVRAQEQAVERGVTGVPTFIIRGEPAVGFHDYDTLRELLLEPPPST